MKSLQELLKEHAFFVLIKVILGLILSIVLLLAFLKDPLEKFELITFDYRMKSLPQASIHPDIVLIEMAEDSIEDIGRWPWPREWHATLIKALSGYKAKAIVFDVLFSEPSAEFGDAALERAIKRSRKVYLPIAFESRGKAIFPLERFAKGTKGQGHINNPPDIDGTLRRTPLIINYKGKAYPFLAFKVASDYLRISEKDLINKIPLDSQNRLLIRWAGKWEKTFKRYSYIDIIKSYQRELEGKKPIINVADFKGKICLIGLTAAALHDMKPNPLEALYPALGVHANVINNILNEDFVKKVPIHVDAIIILVLGLLMSLAISRLRPVRGILVTIFILMGYIFASFALFSILGLWINIIYPVILIISSYLVITLYSQITTAVERARLFKLATRDGVTGLYVLRHFHLLLEAEMRITGEQKHRRRLSIIMGDIDFFKRINDSYGHQGGDVILKDIAAIIKSNCRELDIPCRYGGEEFIMMLPGTTLEEARLVAERIRRGVGANRSKYGNKMLNVTISFGVVTLTDEKDKDELIKKADDALYEAKRTGRNKVCIWKS